MLQEPAPRDRCVGVHVVRPFEQHDGPGGHGRAQKREEVTPTNPLLAIRVVAELEGLSGPAAAGQAQQLSCLEGARHLWLTCRQPELA